MLTCCGSVTHCANVLNTQRILNLPRAANMRSIDMFFLRKMALLLLLLQLSALLPAEQLAAILNHS